MEKCQDNCVAPMKETQVQKQLEFLNKAIIDNNSTVRELLQRLSSVTVQQEKEKSNPDKPENKQPLVDHAEEIRSFGERILCLTTEVRITLDRLEL